MSCRFCYGSGVSPIGRVEQMTRLAGRGRGLGMSRTVKWLVCVAWGVSATSAQAQVVAPPTPSLMAAPAAPPPASPIPPPPAQPPPVPLAPRLPPVVSETGFQIQTTRGDADAYYVTVKQDARELHCSHHVWFGNPCQVYGLHAGPAAVTFGRVGTENRTTATLDIPAQGGVAVLDNKGIPPLWNAGLGLGIAGAAVEIAGLILEFTSNSDTCLQSKACVTGLVFNAVGLAGVLAGSFVRLGAYQALPELRPIGTNETAQPVGPRIASSGPVFGGVGVSVQPKGSSLLLSWNF